MRFLQMADNKANPIESDKQILEDAVARICPLQGEPFVLPPHLRDSRIRTVVEMVTFVARPEDRIATADKPDPLTRCLEKLFEFHRAYRALEKMPCEELTYKRLFPTVIKTRRLHGDEAPTLDGVMLLDIRPNRMGTLAEAIDDADFGPVMSALSRLSVGDPAMSYLERIADARYAFDELGKNAEAAVSLAIACEVIFDGLLGMILWELQTPEAEAAEIFSRDIVPRIKNEYASRLGGNWSLSGGPVGAWYESVAGLRNRVVHSGYQPARGEVRHCFDVVSGLASFILDRLYEKSFKYPVTAWNFLGEDGFAARGGASRRTREWLDDQTETPGAVVRRYVAWRTGVDSLIQRRRKATT